MSNPWATWNDPMPEPTDQLDLSRALVLKELTTEEVLTVAAAKAAIVANLPPGAEMWGDPVYRPFEGDWVYVVAVTPWGPLLQVAAKLSRRKESL